MVDHVFPDLIQNKEDDIPHSDSGSFDQCNYWSKKFPGGLDQEEDLHPFETSLGDSIISNMDVAAVQLLSASDVKPEVV